MIEKQIEDDNLMHLHLLFSSISFFLLLSSWNKTTIALDASQDMNAFRFLNRVSFEESQTGVILNLKRSLSVEVHN